MGDCDHGNYGDGHCLECGKHYTDIIEAMVSQRNRDRRKIPVPVEDLKELAETYCDYAGPMDEKAKAFKEKYMVLSGGTK